MTGGTDFVIEIIFSPSRDLLRLDGLSKLLKRSARVVWMDVRLYLHGRWRAWRKMKGDNWLERKQNWMSSCRIVELSGKWSTTQQVEVSNTRAQITLPIRKQLFCTFRSFGYACMHAFPSDLPVYK